MDLDKQLHEDLLKFYEIPVPFWQQVLGPDLHFHLGHFTDPTISLDEGMREAIFRLASKLGVTAPRVLDVGCGWGGPAFDLGKNWGAEVQGLTISKSQADFVNKKAQSNELRVRAQTIDLETYDFTGIGTFDVLWLCEVLEHITDRQSLLNNLRRAAGQNTRLAITMNCRRSEVPRQSLYNELMGIQPLESERELVELLRECSWNVSSVEDCTRLTPLTWSLWLEKLQALTEPEYAEPGRRLTQALENFKVLYEQNSLQSIQIVAEYAAA